MEDLLCTDKSRTATDCERNDFLQKRLKILAEDIAISVNDVSKMYKKLYDNRMGLKESPGIIQKEI